MSQESLHLWGNHTCPYAQRVRIALIEKKVPYELKVVERVADSSEFKDLYTKYYPHGSPAIPVLQHFGVGDAENGLILPESDIIISYLDEVFFEEGLYLPILPPSPVDRATVRLFIPIFMAKLLPCVRKFFTASTPAELAEATDLFDSGCAALNDFLEMHDKIDPDRALSGDYVVGNFFSFAEIVTAPHLQRLNVIPHSLIRPQTVEALAAKLPNGSGTTSLSLEKGPILGYLEIKYPRLYAWAAAVLNRESVVNTFPADVITGVIANVTVPWTISTP